MMPTQFSVVTLLLLAAGPSRRQSQLAYGEAEKSSRGRPRPKPERVGGPLVFSALAPAPAKNTCDARPVFCGHPTHFGG